MEPKQILIRILSKFQDAGIQSAKKSVEELSKASTQAAQEMAKAARIRAGTASVKEVREAIAQRRTLVNLTKALDKELAKESSQLNKTGSAAARASSQFKRLSSSLRGVVSGFGQMGGGILGALNPLRYFNNLFGRVTGGLLVWEAWRKVKYGFEAIAAATAGANAKLQVAQGAFTAFSGGSEESANQFIGILKQLSVETGVAFDTLLDNAKALPTKVGQNFQAFEEIAKTAIALGFLDPAQGVEGAFFALRNALEGGAQGLRSLIQRFEIGTVREFNAALEETGDVLSALQLMLKRTGLDVDTFIESQRNTYPVIIQSIQSILKELLRISTSQVFQLITDDLVRMRNWLQDNQAALEAIARVVSEKLVVAFGMLKQFIRDIILGGRELTAGNVFQAVIDGINGIIGVIEKAVKGLIQFFTLLANLISGLLGGGQIETAVSESVTQTGVATTKAIESSTKKVKAAGKELKDTVEDVIEAIIEVPAMSTAKITSALTAVTEGGKETIKRYVSGLVEGLDAAGVEKVRDAILNNIIDLERQQLDQEKSVKRIEDWVDAAAKEVEKARDRLKLFDLNTADIPERFTRARRRQLELEVLRAEQEEKRRKAALDAAKEQLAVTKDILQAQRQVLSELESALKDAEGAGGGIFTGFVPPTTDLEGYQAQVESLIGSFRDRLQPTFTRLREDFEKLGQLLRGLFGAESTGRLTEFFEAGQKIRQAVADIASSFENLITQTDTLFSNLFGWWDDMDPGLRKFLLAIILGVAVTKAIPVAISLTWNLGGMALGAATTAFVSGLAALIGGGTVTAGALVLPLTILIAEAYIGWPELVKWFNGERWREIELIIAAKISKPILDLIEFLGLGKRKDPEDIQVELPTTIADRISEAASGIYDSVTSILGGLFSGEGSITDLFAGSESDMQAAAKTGLSDPIISTAEGINQELVGNSIFPDMISRIIYLFTTLPGRLQPQLQSLRLLVIGEMALLRNQWIMDWQAMAQATVDAVNQINAAQMQIQTAAANSTASSASTPPDQLTPIERIRLELNAQETRRLMEEGVADGMSQVARGLRGPGARGGR